MKKFVCAAICTGLLVSGASAETAPADTWSRADAEALCLRWCDALVGLQMKSADPTLDGALHCPACGLFHGRIADIVWPMTCEYVRTGNRSYLTCAERAVNWAERNMLRKGGFYVNDQQSKWIYTTVFSQIAFGRTLLRFRDRLPSGTAADWERFFRRQSEFVLDYFTAPGNEPNVNYHAAFCEGMALAWKLSGEDRFRTAAWTRRPDRGRSSGRITAAARPTVPCEFLFPVTECAADAVSLTGDVRPVPVTTDRGACAFSTVGGFLYRYYRQPPAMSHAIGLRGDRAQATVSSRHGRDAQ